jgi:hypothetical protein
VIPNFFAKQIMMSNQVGEKIIKQVREWDNHIIRTWDYEKANVIYFPSQ